VSDEPLWTVKNEGLVCPAHLGYPFAMIVPGLRRFSLPRCFNILACLVIVLLAAVPPAPAQDIPGRLVTNLHALRLAVQSRQRVSCQLDLTVEVCAVDHGFGLLALRDDSGVEVCEMGASSRLVFAGERLHVASPVCELIRHQDFVTIAEPPVVDVGGVHPAQEKSGTIALQAGLQPIRLFYFNAKDPAELEVTWIGPELDFQPIPSAALFLDPVDASAAGQSEAGLKYFCYDETPATLDEARHQPPSVSGTTTNFDIGLRVPEEYVAMQFRGLLQVPRAGNYTFTVRSDDGSELYVGGFHPDIQVLASNAPPAAQPPVFWTSATTPDAGEWSTIMGHITFAGEQNDGLYLEVQAADHLIRLWLPNPRGISPSLLLNATVRATGVLRPLIGLSGQRLFGIMSVVGPENFRVRQIAAEQWDKYPLSPLTDVASGRPGNFIAHVSGRVTHLRPDGTFILANGTDTIAVKPAAPDYVAYGSTIEVLGNRVGDAKRVEIQSAFCRPSVILPEALPTLTTAAQVQQLTVTEAARQYPVHVRGVVTCQVEWLGAAVQDDTRGVFFNFDASYRDGLEVGDFVDIEGVTAAGDFAPIINARALHVLGYGLMPGPVRPNWNELISGSLDSQYAEVRGIITAVASNTVTLLTDGGKINVQVHEVGDAALAQLQNTLVRIRGCLLAQWDAQTRQVRIGEITFRGCVIEVDQLPSDEPFSAPAKTIADLLRFDLHASGFQRVKVSGQIVHVGDDEIFLMQDGKGLRFRATTFTDLQAGDMVDVVGIPDVSGLSPVLHEAVVRKTGSAPLPLALLWPDPANSGLNPDALRVQVEARLIGIHRAGPEWVLELQTGLRAYRALVNTLDNLADDFPLDSRLRLTGVYATPNRDRNQDLSTFELLLNSRSDIQLLQRPPWWNLRRLLFAVAALLAVLAAAGLWITQLRSKVEQRTVLLEREHTRRERAERERALEFERSRIARDLHDDLGSSLTEIRVMASTGLRAQVTESRSSDLFQSISKKAHNLVSALDVIVWAVDPEANSLQSLADYLGSYAADYLASAGIACRFRIPVALPAVTLDGRARHELFLAVKETLHNIVQHSRATEVEFHLRAGRQMLEIDIIDNGCGFDLNATTESGHGLRNIPERMARMGGSGELKSEPGKGTTVYMRLGLPAVKEA
jgi:signal transduction histidine kinase